MCHMCRQLIITTSLFISSFADFPLITPPPPPPETDLFEKKLHKIINVALMALKVKCQGQMVKIPIKCKLTMYVAIFMAT